MALITFNLFLLSALFFTANAYDLIFKNISVPDELNDKFECTFEVKKGNGENECGLGELETDGRRNGELKWAEDKLCIKVKCEEKGNDTKFAFRLQQCELVDLKKSDKPMKRPIHLIDSNGCLASNAKGQWPKVGKIFHGKLKKMKNPIKLNPPLNYSFEERTVEMRGWTFGNETDIGQFPDEATLSCAVEICADPCEQSCLDKISLDKCSLNDFISDKNATDICHEENAAVVQGTISFCLMTLLMFLCSSTVLMFQ